MHEAIRLGTGRETREIEFGSAGSEVERPNGSEGCVAKRSYQQIYDKTDRDLIIFIRLDLTRAA